MPQASRISQLARITPMDSSLPENTIKSSLRSIISATNPLSPIITIAIHTRLFIKRTMTSGHLYFSIGGNALFLKNVYEMASLNSSGADYSIFMVPLENETSKVMIIAPCVLSRSPTIFSMPLT